ncbi:hypothetical protein [Propionivibrio sp.]|uniref:hypothetical protein n=1 Tax=Propionivibrio sp. TaxID=2212460 RepID=UPI00262A0380|nr:hypothetical protein [Propionivibrio sp.]
MTNKLFNSQGTLTEKNSATWYGFHQEIEKRMETILKPYGYENDSDELPDAGSFLLDVEYSFREQNMPFPWAIIFFPEEYALAGHLLSIRPNREIRFFSYSLMAQHRIKSIDPTIDGAPPLSIIYAFSKSAIRDAAATGSPLLRDAWSILADKSENGNWVVIAEALDPAWVQETLKESEDLYFKIMPNVP